MLDSLIRSFFREGALIARLPDGRSVSVGGATEADAPLIFSIRGAKAAFGILRDPVLGVGEAYMDGGFVIERGTLYDFLELATANLWHYRPLGGALGKLQIWLSQVNLRTAARRNVAHHYDLSRDMFRLFLDADLQYSCAYFRDRGMTLEEAQTAKKRHIAAKLLIEPGHRVLDIGSGWGGLGLTLADEYGADVTGVTLSSEQLAEAQERAARRGLSGHARFELRDYRDVQGVYDRIVSVGMFEHVGLPNFQKFFDTIARLLAPNGVALMHTIATTTDRPGNAAWTRKYIFPGGCIPSLSSIAPTIERSGLVITDLEVLRLHYAETLRAWARRFAANRDKARALYDERFCRMWEFYLAGAEASFRTGSNVVLQFQLAKRKDAVPITRDYITDADRAHAPAHAQAAE